MMNKQELHYGKVILFAVVYAATLAILSFVIMNALGIEQPKYFSIFMSAFIGGSIPFIVLKSEKFNKNK